MSFGHLIFPLGLALSSSKAATLRLAAAVIRLEPTEFSRTGMVQ